MVGYKCNFKPMRPYSFTFSIRFTNSRRLMAQPAVSILRHNIEQYSISFFLYLFFSLCVTVRPSIFYSGYGYCLYRLDVYLLYSVSIPLLLNVHCARLRLIAGCHTHNTIHIPGGNAIILGDDIVTWHKNKLIIYAARTVHTDLIVINKQYEMNNETPQPLSHKVHHDGPVCLCLFYLLHISVHKLEH